MIHVNVADMLMSSCPPITAQTFLGMSGKKQAKQQQQQRPCIKLLYIKVFCDEKHLSPSFVITF